MDLYCKFCREPWENETFHDYIEEQKYDEQVRLRAKAVRDLGGPGVADSVAVHRKFQSLYESELYAPLMRDFQRRGCPALGGEHNATYSPETSKADPRIEAIYEVCGDDSDGAMSMLEDLRLF